MEEQHLAFDILIVGGGPAGLSCALRLAQHFQDQAPTIAILEKGADIGSHTLSGALLDTSALELLLPNWQQLDMPQHGFVSSESLRYLSKNQSIPLPIPKPLKNKKNTPIISITHFCRWLAEHTQAKGIDIFPGFAATELLFNDNNQVCGVKTGDMGLDQHNQPTERFQPGIKIFAPTTILAEGCHGSLSQKAIEHFNLRDANTPQTYGLGIREVWQVQDSPSYQPGHVLHTLGWPLSDDNYGGGFIYHLDNNLVTIGFVVGLDYQNATTDPHQIMQQFKTHPTIKPLFKNGKRLHYGAKSLVEGGVQSLPQLHFPGGCLIGDCAGFLNVAKLKGIHNAMHSGILAADAIKPMLSKNTTVSLESYSQAVTTSSLYQELHQIRNIRPGFKYGQKLGLMNAAIDHYLFRGHAPWTYQHHHDHRQLKPKAINQPIQYPKPDGVLTFDKPSSLYLSHTQHEENQPCHLHLKDPQQAIDLNWQIFGSPEQYYCPAGVYELDNQDPNKPQLIIHASNCLHCKTCSIKDPGQNIEWRPPQGGEGPSYGD